MKESLENTEPARDEGNGSSVIRKKDSWKTNRSKVTGTATGGHNDSVDDILPAGVELKDGETLSKEKPVRTSNDQTHAAHISDALEKDD